MINKFSETNFYRIMSDLFFSFLFILFRGVGGGGVGMVLKNTENKKYVRVNSGQSGVN